MQKQKVKLLIKLMRKTADDLEVGNSNLSEEEQIDLMSMFCHKALTKKEACDVIHLQRSRFDDLVRLGVIPRGKKLRNRKELIWYEDELRAIDIKDK